MVKEIDDDTAKLFARELYVSFSKNPNDSVGGAEYLAEAQSRGINVLDYHVLDLFNNPIIRDKILSGFKSVVKHGKHFDLEEIDETVIVAELEKVLHRGLNIFHDIK